MSFAAVTRNTLKLARTPAKSFSAPCSCQRVAFASTSASSHAAGDAASASKYELPKGLVLRGIVTSAGKMAQTSTVTVERRVTDHKTLKEFSKHTKYLVHDPASICVVGDAVAIRNCKPVSKRKRFELIEVIKGARERVVMDDVADVDEIEGAVDAGATPEATA